MIFDLPSIQVIFLAVNPGARTTVCLMLKAPEAGKVKTRLANEIGADQACAIYQALAEHQLRQLSPEQRLEIHYAPADQLAVMQAWLGCSYAYLPQADGDLGNRLGHAAEGAFARGAESVLLLGGDCPEVTEAVIEQAEARLQSHDVVLGPALDGGYYLIAMNASESRLFERIEWSTEKVFVQTLERIEELKLRCALLPPFADVDDLASLVRARAAHAFLR